MTSALRALDQLPDRLPNGHAVEICNHPPVLRSLGADLKASSNAILFAVTQV
jgi:hypothetical protein